MSTVLKMTLKKFWPKIQLKGAIATSKQTMHSCHAIWIWLTVKTNIH